MFMGADTVLEVDGVSKIYSRSRATTQARIGADLRRAILGRPYDPVSETLRTNEFHAVKDVSFSLKRGEAFGIIGLNGSGKTTLLRMLAGQLLPDRGRISVVGRTASMIDLTAGFQPGASGRENIFLRGGALGRTREEMLKDYDGIVDFAELGDAIEAPVASYSSGMTMRLAFAIVSAVAPDVLFIDEVLAVGDFRFRQKCLARVRELREHSAFVMVSHSMTDIRRFCDRAIVMNKGDVVFSGPSNEAADFYESQIEELPSSQPARSVGKAMGETFANETAIPYCQAYWCDPQGRPVEQVQQNAELHFLVRFRCTTRPSKLIIGVPIWTVDGVYVTGFSTDRNFHSLEIGADGMVNAVLKIPELYLNPNVYHSMLGIVDGSEFLWRKPNEPLRVLRSIEPTWGITTLPYRWEQPGDALPATH